jgi:hypothetical protein
MLDQTTSKDFAKLEPAAKQETPIGQAARSPSPTWRVSRSRYLPHEEMKAFGAIQRVGRFVMA